MVKLHLHQRLLFLSNIHLWLLGACWHSRSVRLHLRLWSKHHRAFSQLLQSSSYHSKVQNKCCDLAQALAVVLDKVTQSFSPLKTLFVCRSHSCTSLFCVTTHYLLFFPNCLLYYPPSLMTPSEAEAHLGPFALSLPCSLLPAPVTHQAALPQLALLPLVFSVLCCISNCFPPCNTRPSHPPLAGLCLLKNDWLCALTGSVERRRPLRVKLSPPLFV